MQIDFWFDVVCPFAYLASERIEQVAAEAGATVRWRPILLGGILKAIGGVVDPNVAMAEPKRRVLRRDMARQAAWLGVSLRVPPAHPRRTLDAMRLLASVPEAEVPALARRLFAAYWVDGLDVSDRAVLRSLCPEADARIVSSKDRLRELTDEAVARGVFGVPTFGVGETLVWGVDRLRFVRKALGLGDDPHQPLFIARTPAPVEWFHDFASPFSYLASTRIRELGEVVRRPILVGALFRDVGTPDVPLHTYPAVKQAWVRADMAAWANALGVPLRFPTRFPIRSVLPLRVAVAEPRATDPIYRAAWAEDRDVADPAVLRAVLDEAGLEGATLVAEADKPAIKEVLRSNTERARELGVFGVPSFRVGEELFFGQDRVHQVALAARGWRVGAS